MSADVAGEREGDGVPPFLSLHGIRKRFPGVLALDDVSIHLHPGRVHALVGENGAGKSTLVKIMSGVLQPDDGKIYRNGVLTRLTSPAEAKRQGINIVPQELTLTLNVSVAENIFMGHLPRVGPFLSRAKMLRQARDMLARVGLDIDPADVLARYPPSVQQLVMIAHGIALGGEIFILDEPTASLADAEMERLFVILRQLRDEEAVIVYVSHRLAEVRELADDVGVMRDGRLVLEAKVEDLSEAEMVRAMVGRPIERFFDLQSEHRRKDEPVLVAEGLGRKGAFRDVSFTLRPGEIVGMAGLMGAGRTEIVRALFGIDRLDEGRLVVDGKPVVFKEPADAIAAGVVLVPEERKSQALVLNRSVADNVVLPFVNRFALGGALLQDGALRKHSSAVVDRVNVKTPSLQTPVGTLSGGNQQKVVLGRWLTGTIKVCLLDEPTRGIDVGAKTEIYAQIGKLAEAGTAVLVVSSELPELLGICDRILVIREGRLVGEAEADQADEESILALAMGTNRSAMHQGRSRHEHRRHQA